MNKIKTLYFGSGSFSIKPLQALLDLDFIEISGVITQPDKPFGRNKELKGSPLMEYLRSTNSVLKAEQPNSLRNEGELLMEKYQPELIIVASYGKIIPDSILDYPKYKCLNLHGSILPKLRGAVPVQMAILQGFSSTGVTLQRMVTKLDEGPIISTREIKLLGNENSEILMDSLADLGADIIANDLSKWLNGESPEIPQNDNDATYCSTADLSRDKAEIKVETPVEQVDRIIRAFYPDPVAWLNFGGKNIKIFRSGKFEQNSSFAKDSFKFTREGKQLFLNLQDGIIEIIELQVEGKKRGGATDHLYLAN